MPRAHLSISLPSDVWIRDLSTSYDATTFEVVTALAGEDAGIALLRIESADLIDILVDVRGQPDVVDADLLWKRERTALVQVETTSPPLLFPLWQAGVPVELPFTVLAGRATWELTTSSDRLSELGEHLDEAAIEYDIESVVEIGSSNADRLLTPRQHEVLAVAIDEGYYAVPREATLTDVAETLSVSKSTCSDILHRCESSIVTWFAAEEFTQP
jgi:predicted DNA binding protein